VVHQDIKPSNILIDASDADNWRLVLTDFGIASRGKGYKMQGGGVMVEAELKGCTFLFSCKVVCESYKQAVREGKKLQCVYACC
jgi:serine/threonine protein kinase